MFNQRNRYDRQDSLELGNRAEAWFARVAQAQGWTLHAAPRWSNIDEHWDFLLRRAGETYRVEVKAMKRIARGDVGVQDAWCWIELHGVRVHDRGWLYDGKADLIAFETARAFLLVKRADLISLVERVVDLNARAPSASAARYKVYARRDRADRIALIETVKLRGILWAEWQKIPATRA